MPTNKIINIPRIDISSPLIDTTEHETEFKAFYDSLGAAMRAALGNKSRTGITYTLNGECRYRQYTGGAIIFHNIYGKFAITGEFYTKWRDLNLHDGPLGLPRGPIESLASNRKCVIFEQGIIIQSPKDTYAVSGYIYARYCELGRETGILGIPTSDEITDSTHNCSYNNFGGGVICYTPNAGAFELTGKIEYKWRQMGAAKSSLGKPISGVMALSNNIGFCARFENGTIYMKGNTTPYAVSGEIRKRWEDCGGVTSWLGFPVSDEGLSPNGQVKYNDFENGIIAYHPQYGAHEIKDLQVYLDRFDSKGNDDWGAGTQDLYVYAKINSNRLNIPKIDKRYPDSAFYDGAKKIETIVMTIPKVNARDTITVTFDGWDSDVGDDTRLGKIEKKFTIDTLWGIFDNNSSWAGNFLAVFTIRPITPLDANKPFRNQYWWPFNNFLTPILTKDQFAQAFKDVDQNDSWWTDPFNTIYYNSVYKTVAENGNCFGMCLESIYARVGRSIFSQPIYRWGNEGGDLNEAKFPTIKNEINIKHGYQVSANVIDWFLGQFFSFNTHDPKHTLSCVKNELNSGDYPIIIVTPKYWKIGAHAVLPYRISSSGNRIYVADPNCEWTHPRGKTPTGINSDPSYIDIDMMRNEFSFIHGLDANGNNEIWSGDVFTGGRFYRIPFSWMNKEARTPFIEVMALIAIGAMIVVAGDADSQQITNENGKTFYKPSLNRTPDRYDDVNTDLKTCIRNMTRTPIVNNGQNYIENYAIKGKGSSLTYKIKGNKTGAYTKSIHSANVSSCVSTSTTNNEQDTIVSKNIGLSSHALEFTTIGKGKRIDIMLKTALDGKGKDHRLIKITGLPAASSKPIGAQIDASRENVIIDNKSADSRVQIDIATSIGGKVQTKTLKDIALRSGCVEKLRIL